MMSAGVESALSNVLEMSTKWNAIIPRAHDLQRNKLVSIFLRMLEYNRASSSGLLTWTRRSRLGFISPWSTASSRPLRDAISWLGGGVGGMGSARAIWKYRMNGREIEIVLNIAQLLAARKGEGLAIGHVRGGWRLRGGMFVVMLVGMGG